MIWGWPISDPLAASEVLSVGAQLEV